MVEAIEWVWEREVDIDYYGGLHCIWFEKESGGKKWKKRYRRKEKREKKKKYLFSIRKNSKKEK